MLYQTVKASEQKPKEGWYNALYMGDECSLDVNNGVLMVTFPNGIVEDNPDVSLLEYLVPAPLPAVSEKPVDMTVEEFYSGFNLSFLSEEERQTIYTATELYAKGKVRNAPTAQEGQLQQKYDQLLEDYNIQNHKYAECVAGIVRAKEQEGQLFTEQQMRECWDAATKASESNCHVYGPANFDSKQHEKDKELFISTVKQK